MTRGVKGDHIGHNEETVTDIFCVDKRYEILTKCVQGAIEEVVPEKKKKTMRNATSVSEKTNELYEKREKEFVKENPDVKKRKEWNKKINKSCRDDYRAWVSRCTDVIEQANKRGDTKEIYRGVKTISGTKKPFATKHSTLNKNGKRISEPEELATV